MNILLYFLQVTGTALGVGVAAIQESVYIYFFQTMFTGNTAQVKQVIHRSVHTTIGNQAHQVNLFVFAFGIGKSIRKHGVIVHLFVAERFIDEHQLLPYNAARTNIHMSYFRITHLPVGQTYIFTKGEQGAVRILLVKTVGKGVLALHMASDLVWFPMPHPSRMTNATLVAGNMGQRSEKKWYGVQRILVGTICTQADELRLVLAKSPILA